MKKSHGGDRVATARGRITHYRCAQPPDWGKEEGQVSPAKASGRKGQNLAVTSQLMWATPVGTVGTTDLSTWAEAHIGEQCRRQRDWAAWHTAHSILQHIYTP